MTNRLAQLTLAACLIPHFAAPALAQSAAYKPSVEIVAGAPAAQARAGRLLLIAQKVAPKDAKAPDAIEANAFAETLNFVAAREVGGLSEGTRLAFYPGDLASPTPIDQLPAGEYWVQAVLDVDHSYAYSMRGAGDVVSTVARLTLPLAPGQAPAQLTLDKVVPALGPWQLYPGMPPFKPADQQALEARIKRIDFVSPALTRFMGQPVAMRGYVLTPEDYDASNGRYPVVYFTHGYQAGMRSLLDSAIGILKGMHDGRMPPMIWVLLDQSTVTGTHEFADSPNNGPWATALTSELLPEIDRTYRTDPAARFLMGHSSGGWAALWLQTAYPKLFQGAWASSPDYTDFSDYGGVDLTRDGARIKDLARPRMEAVVGEYGGQDSSFEWVFSPRGPDGRPLPLYDRHTGLVDRTVAAHWVANWDLSRIVRQRWPQLRADLDGKFHVFVGENDQFGLQHAARRFEAVFKAVGGKADFTYLAGKNHFDLYAEGKERMALRRKIAWQMWRVARPQSPLSDPGPLPAN
ncbi:MAG TPA: alpha/beta hydrolase-fold protein [Burkholderiaceae bacterium]